MRGQSTVEYLLIVSVLALAVALGRDAPLERLMRALDSLLQHYTLALSRP